MTRTNAGRKRRLVIMFTLTFLYMIAELAVGYWAMAMTLRTDAFHMLSDVIALVIGFIAIHLSPKKWERNTFGWARAEVLGALVNAIFLLALCFTIIMDSIQKFILPHSWDNMELYLILGVGGGGLLINLVGLFVFREKEGEGGSDQSESQTENRRTSLIQNQSRLTRIIVPDASTSGANDKNTDPSSETPVKDASESNSVKTASVNEEPKPGNETSQEQSNPQTPSKGKPKSNMTTRSVFLHLLADTANSVVVMVAAGATLSVKIYVGESYKINPKWMWVDYLDPALSVIIVCLICLSTWPLVQETSLILLQNVPPHMSMKVLKEELLAEVPGIYGIHEFHVWQLAEDKFYASIHVKCRHTSDHQQISKDIKTFFHRRGILETTIQTEIRRASKSSTTLSSNCLVIAAETPAGD